MTSFSNIGLAEPSTITKVVASVIIARGSTNEHQEILCLGDPASSGSIAQVSSGAVTSSFAGLVVKHAGTLPVSLSSTAADNPVVISGNSTVFQGTNPWVIGGNSSVRVTFSSTAADNPVVISGNSTVMQGTSPWVISGNSTVFQGTSPWVVSATRINIGSTAADNAVLVSGNSTVAPLAGSIWTVGGGSTTPASSNSSAVYVREVVDSVLTFVSSNCFASSLVAINSTATGQRCRVFAYSVTSTVQSPTKMSFYGGSSLKWTFTLAALSSAVTGVNLAVTPPAYLFQCAAGSSMTFRTPSSVAGVKVSVAYFMGV